MGHSEYLEKFLKPGMKVLDVGCGSGKFLSELVRKAGCYGVGIDPFISDFEAESYKLTKLKAENVDKLDEIFDLVYSIHSFHHLRNPEKFLRNLHNVLSPEGKLVIIDWKKGAYTGIPERYYCKEELESLLKINNFIPFEMVEDSMEIYLAAKRRIRHENCSSHR